MTRCRCRARQKTRHRPAHACRSERILSERRSDRRRRREGEHPTADADSCSRPELESEKLLVARVLEIETVAAVLTDTENECLAPVRSDHLHRIHPDGKRDPDRDVRRLAAPSATPTARIAVHSIPVSIANASRSGSRSKHGGRGPPLCQIFIRSDGTAEMRNRSVVLMAFD